MTSAFYLFRDAPHRRAALEQEPGTPARYSLYGMDQLVERGVAVRHNLERSGPPPPWARLLGAALKRALERAGGYGGDFATVLASLRGMNRADVVFSTVDTVGIPLMLSGRGRLVRRPFVYTAIGLPERLATLGSPRMRTLYARALGTSATILAYSEHEAEELGRWLRERRADVPVEFVPFGVDVDAFRPTGESPELDVVSIGADPRRDFDLLVRVAGEMPHTTFAVVATAERGRELSALPGNVSLETDLAFAEMRRRLETARVVALPVQENSYSGATTVLLQAMALGKPVVVTRTQAIARGYGLVDGENCRLVPPGDPDAFAKALRGVLRDDWHARSLGGAARATVERDFTWERYADRLESILRAAAAGRTGARSRNG